MVAGGLLENRVSGRKGNQAVDGWVGGLWRGREKIVRTVRCCISGRVISARRGGNLE